MAHKNFKHVFTVLTSSILTSNLQSLQRKHLFFDLKVGFENSTIIINLYVKSTDRQLTSLLIQTTPNDLYSSASKENCIKHKANMKSWNKIM